MIFSQSKKRMYNKPQRMNKFLELFFSLFHWCHSFFFTHFFDLNFFLVNKEQKKRKMEDDILGGSDLSAHKVPRKKPAAKKARKQPQKKTRSALSTSMVLTSGNDMESTAMAIDSGYTGKRLWACTDHHTIHPFSPASIVIADDENDARKVLDEKLAASGLNGSSSHKYSLQEIDLTTSSAFVLSLGSI